MITYYKQESGVITMASSSKDFADRNGLNLSTTKRIVYGYDGQLYFEGNVPVRPVTVDDYDRAMEDHLSAEQTARGYTTRSPAEYTNSSNPRWRQDAADWVVHVTEVMEYALEIENRHARGEPVPTLDAFKASLPRIVWTVAAV